MIEVFKTNVNSKKQAEILVVALQRFFPGYTANFDLDDSDRILRVECPDGNVPSEDIIYFLKGFDFRAEVLPDEVPAESDVEAMLRCIIQN
jgi:hypothetical protein